MLLYIYLVVVVMYLMFITLGLQAITCLIWFDSC